MPFSHVHGSKLHYLVRGSGDTVLLVHGLGSSGADWAFQMPALEARFRVVVPDLPGCGHSGAPAGAHSIEACAAALWSLLDQLEVRSANLIGFSLGGAVALEMALQRPESVPRLALINSLASYRVDHWRKWVEARVPRALVRILGMRRTARMVAARLFPEPWQQPMRARAAAVIGAAAPLQYLGMAAALERWSGVERLERLRSAILLIAAEHDYTPLAEKRALAAQLRASLVEVRGSRHGTPFDSIGLTNASLVALLTDQPLPAPASWIRDSAESAPVTPLPGSIVDEHALAGWAHAGP
jgi:pimeloyl-ACP methyl ester carboxylesterase